MAFDLLSQLMNDKKPQIDTDVNAAKDGLVESPEVILEGVNAPEFTEDSVPFDMEEQFAAQTPSATSITLPSHDDGLDDDDEALTSDHVEPTVEMAIEPAAEPTVETVAEPTVEPDAWYEKPFASRYFNFGGRTVNSLTRAGYTCFNDIRGFAYSELKALKGFGQGCLDEVLEYLEAENATDWLLKRKKKTSTVDESVSEMSVSDVTPAPAPAPVPVPVAEVASEAVAFEATESVSENDVPPEAMNFEDIESVSESAGMDFCPEEADESEDEIETKEASAPSPRSLKILVIGGQSYPMSSDLKVASFEMVYRDAIRMICEGAGAPSLASIEFGKGWGALSATIRNNGWANGVDVLTVSNCYMSRAEILMELRLLADLVIEAN